MRRVVVAGLLIVAAVFMVIALRGAAVADRCAEELAARAGARDRVFLGEAIRSPMIAEELAKAFRVELGFVRPISAEQARVGLFVRTTSTATRAEAVVLLLEVDRDGKCVFLRDYETGPFNR